ncbi:MAG: hypothetical protein GXN98_00610 [Euryarchaeota archaeon]|nr:hypothetical protein [Euryarchaeota archaeon]
MELTKLLSDGRNVRYKIIYYSAFNPVTIQEINSAWGYKSPTYLYQKDSLKTLINYGFIIEKEQKGKKFLVSNIDPIFTEKNINDIINWINDTIELSILREYDPHITNEWIEIEGFRERAITNLPLDSQKEIRKKQFNISDFKILTDLWRDPIYIRVFLSLNVISRFSKNDLSSNPLEFIFKYTCSFYDRIFEVLNRNSEEGLDIPYNLSPFYIDEDMAIIYKNLSQAKKEFSPQEYQSFTKKQINAYNLIINKFKYNISDENEATNWLIKEIARYIGIGGG